MIEAYILAIIGVALAQASPGPNMMAVAGAALSQGRAAALHTVAGVAFAMLVWTAAVAFGLASVLAAFPFLMTGMKLIGGAYLCYLGAKALQAAWQGKAASIVPAKKMRTPFENWRRGLLVVLTNPKAALMWIAVGTFLFGSGLSTLQVIGFGPLAFVSATLIYGAYGLLFSTKVVMSAYGRFFRAVETLFGAVFGLLGIRLVMDAFEAIKR